MQTTASSDELPVVVAGAGLAGLAAGASAARAGARVIILDGRSPGGRARTSIRDGFRFNQGPHALYRGGCGRRVLRRLGIRVTGHAPRLRGSRIFAAGCPERFAAVQVARIVARVAPASAAGQAGRSTGEWISSLRLPGEAAAYLAAFIRLTSYVADFGRMPASLAISQLRTALRGADYLDGGWQQLTSALLSCACAAGAQLRPRTRADLVDRARGAWDVYTGGEVIRAAAVVVAVGRPAAAQRLLPAGPHWAQTCPEVTAACLDLGVRSPGAPFILGIDAPLYLSPHCPPGDLAPAGCGLVHVMRYGAGVPAADREQLRGLAAAAGISPGEVVAERFLPRMVVSSWLPSPESGLGGRPPVTVPGPAGLFLAGDWVGPQGWLGDGSLASGERAGLLAARAAGSSM